jgi:hypothetical protein
MENATNNPEAFNTLTGQKNTTEAVRERIDLMRSIFMPQ